MESTTIRLTEEQRNAIQSQLGYEDSMGEWIRNAIDRKLETETKAET